MRGEEYRVFLDNDQYRECLDIVEKRSFKKTYKSHKEFNSNYELLGCVGEMIFSLVSGLDMNKKILLGGDDGSDFKHGVQVKTTEEHKVSHLIEFLDKEHDGYYVLVAVNLEERSGYVCGVISSEDFKAKREIRNFGFGDRYAVYVDDLYPYIPKKFR